MFLVDQIRPHVVVFCFLAPCLLSSFRWLYEVYVIYLRTYELTNSSSWILYVYSFCLCIKPAMCLASAIPMLHTGCRVAHKQVYCNLFYIEPLPFPTLLNILCLRPPSYTSSTASVTSTAVLPFPIPFPVTLPC